MSNDDNSLLELEPWENARVTIKLLGSISSTFSSTIRALLTSAGDDLLCTKDKISPTAMVMVRQLLKSPSLLAHLWYAAKTFYPDRIKLRGTVTPDQLLEIFSIYEISSLLCIIYINRKLTSRLDEKEWIPLSKSLQIYADISVALGQVIPSLGPVRCLLTGSLRWLGWGAMTLADPAAMKKYRVGVKVKKQYFDLEEELKLTRTSHLHIGCSLLTTFGFSTAITNSLFQGIGAPIPALTDDERKFRVAQLWLDSLVVDNAAPETNLGDQYFLEESREDSFLKHVETVLNSGSPYEWLSKKRDDLSPELTPELLVDYEKLKRAHTKPKNLFADAEEEEED